MSLATALFAVVSVFITLPINAYSDVSRRADLVDSADLALRRMARDIQRAVPNSIRIKEEPGNNRVALEMLNTVEGVRYRRTRPGSPLKFNKPVSEFDIVGQFNFALNNTTCAADKCRLIVYNTGANQGGAIPTDNPTPGLNVYSIAVVPNCSAPSGRCFPPPGSVTITPASVDVALSNVGIAGKVNLSAPVQFALKSLNQRLYVSDTPVTYVCNYGSGLEEITRYWDYTINQVQPVESLFSPLSSAQSAPLAKKVTACNFDYSPGTSQRNGIVTLTITVSEGDEKVTLMRQIGVSNAL